MEIGGVERSLIGLLSSIDYDCYEVDLFLHRHSGEFMSLIPKEVNLLPENKKYATYSRPVKDLIEEGFLFIGLARAAAVLKGKSIIKNRKLKENGSLKTYSLKYTEPFMPSLKEYGIYDLAISFLMPHNIVLNKVAAKKKLAWIHTDYSAVYLDKKIELPIWSQFDHVVSISESVTKSFISVMPKLKDKIIQIENILSPHFIKQQSIEVDVKSELRKDDSEVIICSVGRLSYPKNFDQAVYICKYLVEMGFNIKWYIIGDGGEENFIKNNILLAGMQNHFFLLGKKANPYPYIKACDFYIQPSRYEGKAVTVLEAQILQKPVVITRFATSSSQLQDKIDGVIVSMDNELAAGDIADFIRNKEKQNILIKNMKNKNYGNEIEIEKIYKLI
jgi:glycosyltransferase involved in cell wall biosynthesis